MNNFSERIFEALLMEVILGFIGFIVGDEATYLALLSFGTIVAAIIAFAPKITPVQNSSLRTTVHYVEQTNSTDNNQNFTLWLQWILTDVVGMIAVLKLLETLGTPTGGGSITGTWFVGGAVAGVLQWLVLRKQFPNASKWFFATLIGWGGSAPFGLGISDVYLSGIVVGFILGLCQWLILRKYYQDTGWWIIAQTAGYVLGTFMVNTLYDSHIIDFPNMNVIIFAIFLGILHSFFSALALIYILRRPLGNV